MILDSLAPGIVIRAPDKTSARESGDEAIVNMAHTRNNEISKQTCPSASSAGRTGQFFHQQKRTS